MQQGLADAAEQPTSVKVELSSIKAIVEKVHIEGLGRTKDDLVVGNVGELFTASDFQEVVLKAQQVRARLESLGCFKSVGVVIDTSRGPEASPHGLEVTFNVEELSRVRISQYWYSSFLYRHDELMWVILTSWLCFT